MASFDETTWREEKEILRLFNPVTLFFDIRVLEEAVQRFKERQYVIYEFDCRDYELKLKGEILHDILLRLGLVEETEEHPNFMWFCDVLSEVEVPKESGLVLVFKHFDKFDDSFAETAQRMLQEAAKKHFQHLQFGLRFITLVQIDASLFHIEPIYVVKARWNDKEARINSSPLKSRRNT